MLEPAGLGCAVNTGRLDHAGRLLKGMVGNYALRRARLPARPLCTSNESRRYHKYELLVGYPCPALVGVIQGGERKEAFRVSGHFKSKGCFQNAY